MQFDESVPDDWANESVKSEESGAPPPRKQVATAIKTKPNNKIPPEYKVPEHLAHSFLDSAAEQERLKLVAEHRDMWLSGEMFGVTNLEDPEFDRRSKALLALHGKQLQQRGKTLPGDEEKLGKIQLNRMKEIEEFCELLEPAILNSTAKSQCWLRLLDRLLAACESKMEPQDLKTLERKVADAQKGRVRQKNVQQTSSKKASDMFVNMRNYEDELAIYEGLYDSD